MFQIAPFGYEARRLSLETTDGPEQIDVLIFGDTGGRRGYAFRSDTFKAFAASMVQASSGLIIPGNNGGNEHHA